MKLKALSTVSVLDICEGVDPGLREKLAFIDMMIARQGKDPEPVIKRLRGMIDPDFAQYEGRKATFKSWIESARTDETKIGMVHGRKVRVTVLEAAMRDVISEGILGDITNAVKKKLRDLFYDEPTEHKMVKAALDEFPSLSGLKRYAAQFKSGTLYDDDGFWSVVDKVTSGKSGKIKEMVNAIYRRRMEESQENMKPLLSECVIEEAKVSDVMGQLGIEPGAVQSIMNDFKIEDQDYDISRMKAAVKQTSQKIRSAPGRAMAGFKSKVKEMGSDAKEMNEDFADTVILAAAYLMKVPAEQDAGTSPLQAVEAVTADLSGQKEPTSPNVVSTGDLGVAGGI